MEKFEYRIASCSFESDTKVLTWLNKQGYEGWELVCVRWSVEGDNLDRYLAPFFGSSPGRLMGTFTFKKRLI